MNRIYLVETKYKFSQGIESSYCFFLKEDSAYENFKKQILYFANKDYYSIWKYQPVVFLAVYKGDLTFEDFRNYQTQNYKVSKSEETKPAFNYIDLYYPCLKARKEEFVKLETLDFSKLTKEQFETVAKNYAYYVEFNKEG